MKRIFLTICFVLCAATLVAGGKKDKQRDKSDEQNIEQNVEQGDEQSIEQSFEMSQEIAERILIENGGTAYQRETIEGEPAVFDELWGFVLASRPGELNSEMPLSDIAVFTATLDNYAELADMPKRSNFDSFDGRVHLTFACDNRSTVHFVLDDAFGLRDRFERSLAKAAEEYDGLCIDMEYIPARDKENFFSFLASMKRRIGEKMLSVCVPARTRTLSNDIFDYSEIEAIADRIIVMAYDEHWSTSEPGPVASLQWCSNVADYALSIIPKEKLVMGLPFYGRTWQAERHAAAWYFSGINRRMLENNIAIIERDEGGVPKINYEATVTITGYFDDTYSLVQKCRLYERKGIANVSFWRIGQEDALFWQWVSVKDNAH